MDDCKHGLALETCALCRDETPVYMSAGGIAYHQRRDCPAFESGQDIVLERGGELLVPVPG